MLEQYSFLAALIVGVIGATHCIGMCGGIAGLLAIGGKDLNTFGKIGRALTFNLGRIASYVTAGAIAGLVGSTLISALPVELALTVAATISAVFALLMALYILGWDRVLFRIERFAGKWWRYLQPLSQKYLPARNPSHALLLGAIWGWLPCGLVYSMLAWALASGSAITGASLMLGFGLGTLPSLLTLGIAGSWIAQWRKLASVRYIAGSVLIVLAIITLTHGFSMGPVSTYPHTH